ncbi:MAG: hypothetical protein AB1724_12390 [Thermodesulfobacteriota bacterium]
MGATKSTTQLVWGLLLVMAGIGVVIRANLLDSEMKTIAGQPSTEMFIRICVYVMAVLLIGGGIRKIRNYFSKSQ